MSFSYSSGVITQSGTDTDLSGLSGLTGVTHTNGTYYDVYTLDSSTELLITGTLTINPESETLVCQRTPGAGNNAVYVSTGTLNIGTSSTVNSYTRYRYCEAIVFDNDSTENNFNYLETWANLYVDTGGTVNWYGGSILSGGPTAIYGALNTYGQTCVLQGTSVNDAQARLRSANVSINGLTLIGHKLTVITQPSALTGINPIHSSGVIDMSGSSTSESFYEIEDLIAGQGNDRELGGKHTTYVRFLNTNTGSDVIVESQTVDGTSDQDYLLESRMETTFTFEDLDGIALSGVKVYMEDTDNGSRLANSTIGTAQPSYTADRTYSDTSDANGICSWTGSTGAVLISVHWHSNENGAAIYDNIDYRGLDNDSTDRFRWRALQYGYSMDTFVTILKGNGGYTATRPQIPDIFITQATKATVDAYTTIDDAFELYDRMVSYVYANIDTISAFLVSRSSEQIDLGAVDLVIDSTAGSAFAYSATGDGTITVKSTTFTGGATATTGGVTVTGASALNGGTFDCDISYDSTATTITNVTCTGAIDFTTAGTYTLSGCTISEVTNSSGGAVTLTLTNGSSVTTNTGPSITINTPVTVKVTALDTSGSPIEGARVYLEAGAGGPLTQGTEILNTTTNASGIAQDTAFNYTSDQPLQNSRVRRGTASPYYVQAQVAGTITSMGFDATVTMVEDV